MLLPVKIFYENSNVMLNTLVDTGNTLHEPLSRSPVIIAEFNTVKDFLPDNVRLVFYENNENDLGKILENVTDNSFYGRIRMIPFKSIGKQNGLLIGFRPDKVEIIRDSATMTLKDVVIGIYNSTLSRDGAYQGLLSPELIQ